MPVVLYPGKGGGRLSLVPGRALIVPSKRGGGERDGAPSASKLLQTERE